MPRERAHSKNLRVLEQGSGGDDGAHQCDDDTGHTNTDTSRCTTEGTAVASGVVKNLVGDSVAARLNLVPQRDLSTQHLRVGDTECVWSDSFKSDVRADDASCAVTAKGGHVGVGGEEKVWQAALTVGGHIGRGTEGALTGGIV